MIDINNVIVRLMTYPAGIEIARDTSNAVGAFEFTGLVDGNYRLSYEKFTCDTMQYVNDVNAIDVALMKYLVGHDTVYDPSSNFKAKYKKASNVDNNLTINAVDVGRTPANIKLGDSMTISGWYKWAADSYFATPCIFAYE